MASPFSGLLLLPHKLSTVENAIQCYSPIPGGAVKPGCPQRDVIYSQPTRNARVRHGSPEGTGQAYLIGFVLAVTVISVLAGTGNYLEISRRTQGLSHGTLIKLGSEWDWNERRYWPPAKTIISGVLTGIDADEMARSSGNGCSGQSREDAGSEWEIDLDGWVSVAREPRGE